jgi:hypothetical protein
MRLFCAAFACRTLHLVAVPLMGVGETNNIAASVRGEKCTGKKESLDQQVLPVPAASWVSVEGVTFKRKSLLHNPYY